MTEAIDRGPQSDGMCTSEVCGNGLDEDCDGQVDECPAGTECIAGLCEDSGQQGQCESSLDCNGTELCDSNRCTPYRVSECGANPQCTGRSHCTTTGGGTCSAEPSCLGTAGGSCTEQCDCGGDLLCEAATNRCVACVNDGQCDGDARCDASGHCMLGTAIPSGTLTNVREDILTLLNACMFAAHGRRSVACHSLSFDQPLLIDGEPVERMTIAGLLGAVPCEVITTLEGRFPRLLEAFGCHDGESHILWNNSIDTRVEPAACVLYLPYVPDPAAETGSRWAVWFGPCDQAGAATF